ncbi:TPR and ankyrin repeat-containing protein 1-like [Pecten maximus]|uniref:TPR and ankyrin repeat-containing protein 1-like n=1 Tax=Pecten maximus TaxID=6579 RepID=UPI0014588B4F|nr:TPR and ankyrin repeat-containing protein 1-like [Pecten maximus]
MARQWNRSHFAPPPPGLQDVFPEVILMEHLSQLKANAQSCVDKQMYEQAIRIYSQIMGIVAQIPQLCLDELPKALSNRSLVLAKIGDFRGAFHDAHKCTVEFPRWPKGHWRAAMALKGLKDNYASLQHLRDGFNLCISLDPEDRETVNFMVETINTVCSLKDDPADLLSTLEVPYNYHSLLTRVVLQLSKSNQWEGTSLLVLGIHSGLSCPWEGIAKNTPTHQVTVAFLVKCMWKNTRDLKKWGHKLLVMLCKNGASVNVMEKQLETPAIHTGLRLALASGQVDFLKYLFESYLKTAKEKDAKDSGGSTALHNLVVCGQINTTLGETILRLFLNNGCSTKVIDKSGKTPIQYLGSKDAGYAHIQAAEKAAVEELRRVVIELKDAGNKAHKNEGYHSQAVEYYTQAYTKCIGCNALKNEAAILLTNRSNVLSVQGKHNEALADAEKAIEYDHNWFKGHWRKGQVLRVLGDFAGSFGAFLAGFAVSKDVTVDQRRSFLAEAVISLSSVKNLEYYDKLSMKLEGYSDTDWTYVLARLSRAGEWKSIRDLVMGSERTLTHAKSAGWKFEDGPKGFGVALNAPTTGMTFCTIFPFVQAHCDEYTSKWMTILLKVLLDNGGGLPNFLTFVQEEHDTPLHAAVKYSLITGQTMLLDDVPLMPVGSLIREMVDKRGDSVFHIITKNPQTKDMEHILKVTRLLLDKEFSVKVKDRNGRTPIDYVKQGEKEALFDLLLKQYSKDRPSGKSKQKSPAPAANPLLQEIQLGDPKQLRELGNKEYTNGNYTAAIELYSLAIKATPQTENCDLCKLYGNRAECHLRLGQFQKSLEDAMDGVSYDGHWYKAHLRVGKAMGALGSKQQAVKALVNAFSSLTAQESESVRREVLVELAIQYAKLDKFKYNERIPGLQNVPGEVWARASYDLVCRNQNNPALVAFKQLKMTIGTFPPFHMKVDLRPFCSLSRLATDEWMLELVELFLACGSDHNTLSVQAGDRYIHAVVKMTLAAGVIDLLPFTLHTIVIRSEEQNLLDSHGNTALHIATRDSRASPPLRLNVIMELLDANISTLQKNSDSRLAVEYVSKGESQLLAVIFEYMKAEEAMNRQMKMQHTAMSNALQQKAQQDKLEKKRLEKQKLEQQQIKERQEKLERQERERQQRQQQKQAKPQVSRPEPVQFDHCETCDQYMNEGKEHLRLKRTGKAYIQLSKVIRKKHKGSNNNQHQRLVNEALALVTRSLSTTFNPEIPENLARIPVDFYQKIIDGLAKEEKWRQVDIMVRENRKYHGDLSLRDFAKNINISRVIRHPSFLKQDDLLAQLIDNMLDSGAIMEHEGKMCILAAIQEEHFKLLCTLFDRGAKPVYLSLQPGDTPIHAALSVALERDKGNFAIFNVLLDKFKSDPEKFANLDPNQQDANGDGLFHLVAKMKYNSTTQKATELLCEKKISALVYNNEGKLPKDYLINKKNDRRLQFFRLASVEAAAKKPKKPRQKLLEDGMLEDEQDLLQYERTDEAQVSEVPEKLTRKDKKLIYAKSSTHRDTSKKKIEEMIFNLPDTPYSIFNPKVPRMEESWKSRKSGGGQKGTRSPDTKGTLKVENLDETSNGTEPSIPGDVATATPPLQNDQVMEEVINGEVSPEDEDEEEEEKETYEVDVQAFDNLDWEVECTSDVWRTLRDNHVLPELKQRIVRKVQHLASGEWRRSLCKPITASKMPETLRLFEAKLSKGGRIIWELAIAFSPRLSESAERRLNAEEEDSADLAVQGGRIYSEVIRVWDIVFNHDHIYRCVERIIKSHNRGEECIIQKKLKGVKQTQFQEEGGKRYPMIFAEADVGLKEQDLREYQQELQRFYPPASSNDTEYHILKFYSFSSNLVYHVLQNIETKVDFPFRVTDLEHAIINLRSQAPILLLGRSGTGKTTCCLYRLWTQFLSYWTKATQAEAPLLPRCPIYRRQEEEREEDDEEGEDNEDEGQEADDPLEELLGATVGADGKVIEENGEEKEGQIYDHLHQIFITKNAVLCNEVQKNFRELSHACAIAKNHVEVEDQVLPPRLQDIDDYRFPLFITSKQLLLMLDASLGPPYFFERGEDGGLKVDVQGWTDGEGTLSILPLLAEDSDDEDDDDGQFDDIEDDDDDERQQAAINEVKVDPRREITYDVFSKEIWPKICKKFSGKYHPSLVWTEIMSFIKGSFEALSKPNGILQKEEYFELGKKRAPSFSGRRSDIYDIFKRYDHFKKQKFLFDETDLVRSVYNRLKNETDISWVVHQVFVDETQDFTQAELCLLLRICQDPNQMFLTGDTAQSIMRGIAFRFSDLKSIFYYAKQSLQANGKVSSIEVPKRVHQLTHNYRSHAGILFLASSILDLMVRFFPESFDRLQKDQGLFNGPPPVLLESCSFSDLAMLLRGSRRKTSHIEFGAHQAILVVDEAARDNIPEELQLGLILTIYEAKGLEFDDILLYNFFKDSQAVKEWRVVTEYLEELVMGTKGAKGGSLPSHQESLVEIDADVLQQTNRPRALKFDASLHKVLNSELKHLYTAVTRARVNVWIFDEDQEKRAPMFEYFKARKLVKILNSTDVDEDSPETIGGMFAEESSPEDWIRRGDDFMKHALYEVAAKCFIMGGDHQLHKVALAHQQALKASRTKDSHQHMRDEFLFAAEMFLDCSLPSQAAKCLQNARERELVAHLFEKIGWLERAGETYRKTKRPIEGSRCYEQLGHFNLAIDTLCENEFYDMAIDTLWRYNKLIEGLRSKNQAVPAVLLDHAPDKLRTRERLSHMAAEFHHRNNNEVRMMVNLERLESLNDRVTFLKSKGYFDQAGALLQKEGKYVDATHLYIVHGKTGEAVKTARQSAIKDLIGECLIVDAQVKLRKKPENKLSDEERQAQKEEIIQALQEAIDILLQTSNSELRGEACFLKGEISNEVTDINESWGAFNKCTPRCEAGQLECMDWMVHNSDLHIWKNLSQVVKGMENLFGVLNLLVSSDKVGGDRIFKYYGLRPTSDGFLKMFPLRKPLALQIMKGCMKKAERKKTEYEVARQQARDEICRFLLDRGHSWYCAVTLALNKLKKQREQCREFILGFNCTKATDGGKCLARHDVMTEKALKSLLDVDLLHLEMDWYVQQGCGRLLKNITSDLTDLVNVFLPDTKDDHLARFKSCEALLHHLMPREHFPFRMTEMGQLQANRIQDHVSKILVNKTRHCREHFRERKYLKEHMVCYLKAKYTYMKTQERKTNTDVFVKLYFLANYLQLKDVDTGRLMMQFETEIQKEYLQKNESKIKKRLESFGFLVDDKQTQNVSVQCVARRFFEAYYQLTVPCDPLEALIKFTKFIVILGDRNKTAILPEFSDFLMWTEYFTTIAVCFGAKYNQVTDVFFLPASYISLVYFIDSSFKDNGQPTFEIIQRNKTPWGKHRTLSQDRAERIISILCGAEIRMNLIRHLFKPRDDRDLDYGLAERLLVLCMTVLCNMGKALFAHKESNLMQQLCLIALPKDCPPRLVKAVRAVQEADGISDIAAALKELLQDRDKEHVCLCHWSASDRYGIRSTPLDKLALLPSKFFNSDTKKKMANPGQGKASAEEDENVSASSPAELETDMTMEEKYKWENEKKTYEENQQKENSALIITRFFRQIRFRLQCSILHSLVEEELLKEQSEKRQKKFLQFGIDDRACTICDVTFDKPPGNLVEGRSYAASLLTTNLGSNQKSPFPSIMNPFSALFSNNSGQTANVEELPKVSEMSVDLAEPVDETGDNQASEESKDSWRVKQKLEHEESQAHLRNMQNFKHLKVTYKTQIAAKQEEILEFIRKHNLRTEKGLKNYADMKLDLGRLVSKSDMTQNEFERILAKRDWGNLTILVQLFHETNGCFLEVKTYVEEQWRKLQESKERNSESSKAWNSQTVQNEDWEDELQTLEDVVQEPVRQREKKGKGRGRGRGRARQKQQDD